MSPRSNCLVCLLLVLATATLSCSRGPSTDTPKAPAQLLDSVTLTCRPPRVGESWTVVSESVSEYLREGMPTVKQGRRGKVQLEILAVSATEVIRAKSTKVEAVERSYIDGQEVLKPSPTQGKSYLYERSAQGLVVTRADGTPVPEEEAMVKSPESLGDPSPVLNAVSGKTFQRAKPVTLSPEELRRATADSAMPIPRIVLTYEGRVGTLARFRSEPTIGGANSDYSGAGTDTLLVDPTTCQVYDVHAINVGKLHGGKLTIEVNSHRLP